MEPSPSKYLFSVVPEQQPWAETDSDAIFQVPVSVQNLKDWMTTQISSLPL